MRRGQVTWHDQEEKKRMDILWKHEPTRGTQVHKLMTHIIWWG